MIKYVKQSNKNSKPVDEQSKGEVSDGEGVEGVEPTDVPGSTKEKGRPMGTAGTVMLVVVAILVVACALLSIVAQDKTADIWVFGYKPTFVVSNSMEPAISTYAMCIMQKVHPEDIGKLAVGDIVVYRERDSDSLIIHRLLEIRPNVDGTGLEYITKGDHNQYQDRYPVTAEQIRGKVVAIGNWTAPIISLFTGEKSVSSSNYNPEHSRNIRVILTILCAAVAVTAIVLEVRGYKDARKESEQQSSEQVITEVSLEDKEAKHDDSSQGA